MEETLTDCLVRVKEDLSQLKRVRDYLDKNAETRERCFFSWRTIEAFNSILSVCASQNTSENNALDTLLDSFYYLARNNANASVWDNFGFELGIICVKVLSAIERTNIFEILFSKLLSVITVLCKHNSGIWKATARQILNVLINKKFSLNYLEGILKSYIRMIRNVESFVLYEFSSRNLDLLKTVSLLVQKVGDFEIQSDIVEMIFLHLSNDIKLMSDFFTTENQFFQSLQFGDFEGDCRLFLNALNKSRRELEKKVYSLCCSAIYLGGCFVEPPIGRNYIWVDANKDTERLSLKYGVEASYENRIIHVQFSELVNVYLDTDNNRGSKYLTIETKSLRGWHEELTNDHISLVVENADGILDFVNFLEAVIRGNQRKGDETKISTTVDCLFIDIRSSEQVQDSAVTSSRKPGLDHLLPDAFSPTEKMNQATLDINLQRKSSKSLTEIRGQVRTPPQRAPQEHFSVFGNQELSANSFTESLSKHLISGSPESKHTFENSIQTVEFLQKNISEKSHKLFRGPEKTFNFFQAEESENFTFIFKGNKENNPPLPEILCKIKTHKPESQVVSTGSQTAVSPGSPTARGVIIKKKIEANSSCTQSQDYFQGSSKVLRKKKPCLPKLKRMKKAVNKEFTKDEINKDDLDVAEKTKSRGFPRNNATEQNIGKIPLNYWKLDISGSLKRKKNLRKNMQIKEKKLLGQAKNSEGNKSSKKVKGNEITEGTSSTQKTQEVFRRKVRYIQHRKGEGDRQKNQSWTESLALHSQIKSEIEREETETPGTKAKAKPSLLDPNGYAYKRWCRPTTSERSNFWLKKLKTVEKSKNNFSVFEFSEDSDSNFDENIKQVKALPSGRSRGMVETKLTSLRHEKEFLKIAPEGENLPKDPREESQEECPENHSSYLGGEEFAKSEGSLNSILSNYSSATGSQEKDAEEENFEQECVSKEDEVPAFRRNKREHPEKEKEEEGFSMSTYVKKPEIHIPEKIFLSILQRAEERDRHQTDQVIRLVKEAVCRLISRIQEKDEEKTKSCLKAAEMASKAVAAETDALDICKKRIQRVILYFEAGCSVSDACKTLEEHFSRARSSLNASRKTGNTLGTLDRIGGRLSNLIRSEAERTIENEWTARRDLLLKCACFGD